MVLLYLLLIFNLSNAFFPLTYDILALKLKLISESAEILPKIDIFGHEILNINKQLINYVIDMNDINIDIKKNLILKIVHATQFGDEFGNIVLHNYEKLVNNII